MAMRDRVVVVGASGFGRETLDVLEAMIAGGAELEVAGVLDDAPSTVNLTRLVDRGVSYLGTTHEWLACGDRATRFLVGIGDPSARLRVAERVEQAGFTPFTAVHPSATLGTRVRLGEGVVVCAGAAISTNVRLARHVHVNPHATIGHDSVLDAFVSVNPSATISGDVRVARETLVGASATVLQGLSVGQHSIVGAGAVVTKDVPSGVVVVGVPGVSKPRASRSADDQGSGVGEP